MKLPLDNFQVLGASPASSIQNILMILERKLERCPYPGFSQETINKRAYLLQDFSKPLLDYEERQEFEKQYRYTDFRDDKKPSLRVPEGYEIAGLLLLLEARQFEECLCLANDFLQGVNSDLNGNTFDLADLYLLIGHATLEYGRELKSKRYYDYCAQILENGLTHLQDRHDLQEIRTCIQEELEEITPFRILDLVSRDMDEPRRVNGIQLLNEFVNKRGGLDNESDLFMEDREFKYFFRQIRYYLTVQEQIDLYQQWCISGSQSACFLLAIALVASGFARRKPERLVEALKVMSSLESDELKEMMAYVSLLLGRVEVVTSMTNGANQEGEQKSGDSFETLLGQLCAHCREWLERDVLEGYRDLEADPDLEAYFSDRDVTSFIEQRDGQPSLEKEPPKSLFGAIDLSGSFLNRNSSTKKSQSNDQDINVKKLPRDSEEYSSLRYPKNTLSASWIVGIVVSIVCLLLWIAFAKKNKIQSNPLPKKDGKTLISSKTSGQLLIRPSSVPGKKNPPNYSGKTLDKQALGAIISEWLRIKTVVLSGQEMPSTIKEVATIEAIERLNEERKEDQRKKEIQQISAQIVDLRIVERSKNKIVVDASLGYSDKRLDHRKTVLETTPRHVFNKRYILVNRDSRWLIQ